MNFPIHISVREIPIFWTSNLYLLMYCIFNISAVNAHILVIYLDIENYRWRHIWATTSSAYREWISTAVSLNDGSRGAQVVKVHDQHPSDTQLPDKGFPAGVQQFFSWVDLSGTYSNIWLWEHWSLTLNLVPSEVQTANGFVCVSL